MTPQIADRLFAKLETLKNLGYRPDAVLQTCIDRNWQGLEIDWIHKPQGGSQNGDGKQSPSGFDGLREWIETRRVKPICAAYPKSNYTALTVEVYYERLSAHDRQSVLDAIGECLDTCKWFPTIAEIIEKIKPLPKPKIQSVRDGMVTLTDGSVLTKADYEREYQTAI
jgi:hypothetical protein